MENSTEIWHLISHLPEVIHKILEFQPHPDLESACLVNSTWEEEALKHLLARNPVHIHPRNVTDPSDVLHPLRMLFPSYVRIFSQEANNLDSLIDLFNTRNFKNVTKLWVDFPLEKNLRHVACNLVKILGNESFKNLKSLKLQPTMTTYGASFSSEGEVT
ncbi:uncharacterized protein LOC118439133 isoform X2 [Folsomia candida]|uniref:uncharacterized protein LOC118439133 isoform X2 n=1 Tax=Folsomia candida TaxID=158441 RepID=UPI001604DC79|nr:uncharacterized protein LOC118439133 isoform X2 [Folsomia candida]